MSVTATGPAQTESFRWDELKPEEKKFFEEAMFYGMKTVCDQEVSRAFEAVQA